MRINSWTKILSLAVASVMGFEAFAAEASEGSYTQKLEFGLTDHMLVLGQSCDEKVACDVGDDDDDCDCLGNWRDNTYVTFGGDAYKSIGDAGLAGFAPTPFANGNSFGLVSGFNTGFRLGDSSVRGQVGGSFGAYDFKGRTIGPKNDSLEQQSYATIGVYKRSDVSDGDRVSWGLVYDAFFGHQYGWAANEIFVSQLRYTVGYAINECNELGMWGTFQTHDDDDVDLSFPIAPPRNTVRAMNQVNSFWNHNWQFGGTTMGYVGVFDPADVASWQFGLLNQVPVSHNASVYANFSYAAAGSNTGAVGAAEEQWNVGAGFVFYLGGKAVSDTVSGNRGLPLLPIANNGNFLITN